MNNPSGVLVARDIPGYWRDEETGRYYRIAGAPESILQKIRDAEMQKGQAHSPEQSRVAPQRQVKTGVMREKAMQGVPRVMQKPESAAPRPRPVNPSLGPEFRSLPGLLFQRQLHANRSPSLLSHKKVNAYLNTLCVGSASSSRAFPVEYRCACCVECEAMTMPRQTGRILDRASARIISSDNVIQEYSCRLEVKPCIPRNQLQLAFSELSADRNGQRLLGTRDHIAPFLVFRETYSVSLACPEPKSVCVCLGRKDKCMVLTLRERNASAASVSRPNSRRDDLHTFRSDVLDTPGMDVLCSALKFDGVSSGERASLLAGSRQGRVVLAHLKKNRFERDGSGASWQLGKGESIVDVMWSSQSPNYSFFTSRTCALSNGGRTNGRDKTSALCMWDLRNMRWPVIQFLGHVNDFKSLKLFESAGYLISPGTDRCVRMWDSKQSGNLASERRYVPQLVLRAELYNLPGLGPESLATAPLLCSSEVPAGCLWSEDWKPILLRHQDI